MCMHTHTQKEGQEIGKQILHRKESHMAKKHGEGLNIISKPQNANTTMRYLFTPIQLQKNKTSDTIKYWRWCKFTTSHKHHRWECILMQPLWKKVWHGLLFLINHICSSNSVPRDIPETTTSTNIVKLTHKNVHITPITGKKMNGTFTISPKEWTPTIRMHLVKVSTKELYAWYRRGQGQATQNVPQWPSDYSALK